ncbi:hypothetical protein MSG28_003453 [Choristoneura fumiferana]|uniref:Uncharacterized protein n=1 Tax=Choristoneura fumiferana TaxID=7141 RepID=A0ACC0KFN3_CHOFU|nr:hypothetical protein MSG28_003453 [Choristoneura fumiferana]
MYYYGVMVAGLIYVVGGCTHSWRHTRDLLCFNPATRGWRALAPMRREALAVAMTIEEKLRTWEEYIKTMFHDTRSQQQLNSSDDNELDITKEKSCMQ